MLNHKTLKYINLWYFYLIPTSPDLDQSHHIRTQKIPILQERDFLFLVFFFRNCHAELFAEA
jgi:hypothetical protein